MIDTSMFFRNPFNSKDVSDQELRQFAEEHLKQLSESNKDGYFTTMIAETIHAYNACYHPENIDKSPDEINKQQDDEKRMIFDEFIKLVNLKEKTIRYISEEISAIIYHEFFPAGLDEFNHAALRDAERLFSRTINASKNHTKELGQQFVDQLIELKKRFSEVRNTNFKRNLDSNNGVNGTGTKNRNLLEIQLMKNLLTCAIVYVSDPEIGMSFFLQHHDQATNEGINKRRTRVRSQDNLYKT